MEQPSIIPQEKIVQVPTDPKINEFEIATHHTIEQKQTVKRQATETQITVCCIHITAQPVTLPHEPQSCIVKLAYRYLVFIYSPTGSIRKPI